MKSGPNAALATPLILRELLRGTTSFNDLHRGVPRMSRSLLSQRLRKLGRCGVLRRRMQAGAACYELTAAGPGTGRLCAADVGAALVSLHGRVMISTSQK